MLRLDLSHQTTYLLSLYRQALETSIRILEQTIHGCISRNTRTKAEYLSTVAEGMSRKLQLQQNQLLTLTKSPEMQEALSLRSEELEREVVGLRRKIREKKELLGEYKEAGKGGEGMAREYAGILGEVERVMGDLARLEGSR